jgi:aldose 1-epimerase
MALHLLTNQFWECWVSTHGGSILQCKFKHGTEIFPVLRGCSLTEDHPVTATGCFPLVPFGNRIKNNAFKLNGDTHELRPNTADQFYLHGDGWLADWALKSGTSHLITLVFNQTKSGNTPYIYHAEQSFELLASSLRLKLTIQNQGTEPMPFGLGWHPYFTLTPKTTLCAPATQFHTEAADHLPLDTSPVPVDLNFNQPAQLPKRWVNNAFSGWNGSASIRWPEHHLQLDLESSENFQNYFLFMPNQQFNPNYQHDYFCFEPMTHIAGAHQATDLGGLVLLKPGGQLSASMTLRLTFCREDNA